MGRSHPLLSLVVPANNELQSARAAQETRCDVLHPCRQSRIAHRRRRFHQWDTRLVAKHGPKRSASEAQQSVTESVTELRPPPGGHGGSVHCGRRSGYSCGCGPARSARDDCADARALARRLPGPLRSADRAFGRSVEQAPVCLGVLSDSLCTAMENSAVHREAGGASR
jgi:hypothetical protein